VGNDASGKFPWTGTVNTMQIWDLALRREVAQQLSAGQATDSADPGLLVDYDFSAGPPFRNQRQIFSELTWFPSAPATSTSGLLLLDGASWLTSRVPVPDLIANLGKTNQFTLRVVCTPAQGTGGDGRIISISQPSGVPDLVLRQEDSSLAFWFRNPLSASHSLLAWIIPGVFTANRTRDILYSYDGSNLSLFIDGKPELLTYRLGAGTALAKSVRLVKAGELEGYNYIYYALVFCFPGAILGIAARNLSPLKFTAWVWLACGFLIPAVVVPSPCIILACQCSSHSPASSGSISTVGASFDSNPTKQSRVRPFDRAVMASANSFIAIRFVPGNNHSAWQHERENG
jgi:hypothetical protein